MMPPVNGRRFPFISVAGRSLPYGHGEKSVYLIERFMRLKTDEAIAIRWHMGGFDDAVRGGSFAVSDAYNQLPAGRQAARWRT